nr:hypothetical protein [Actinomadura logoneensis]
MPDDLTDLHGNQRQTVLWYEPLSQCFQQGDHVVTLAAERL